jgi:hypothetical protein
VNRSARRLVHSWERDEQMPMGTTGNLLRIHGSGGCVISEAEPVPVASSPFIEKALIGAVPTAFCF